MSEALSKPYDKEEVLRALDLLREMVAECDTIVDVDYSWRAETKQFLGETVLTGCRFVNLRLHIRKGGFTDADV